MNKIIITGRLATELRIAATQSGAVVVSFRFAVNRPKKADGQQEADFFNIVAYGKVAETLKRLVPAKGTKLAVIGTLRNAHYTDKNGLKHYAEEIVIDTFEFLEPKKPDGAPAQIYDQPSCYVPPHGYTSSATCELPGESYDEDLPF